MIVAYAGYAAISSVLQAYSFIANRNRVIEKIRKQEEYQVNAQEDDFKHSMQMFEELCNAKMQFQLEEAQEQKRIMDSQHEQNIHDIAQLMAWENWPLDVLPLVMRDGYLFVNQTSEDLGVTPINIIMGPCNLYMKFHKKVWKFVEEELSERFAKYWNTQSQHPVIFYQDAWKDRFEAADGTQCSNIHAATPKVPTIVFSPNFFENELSLTISHWGITGYECYERGVTVPLTNIHCDADNVDKLSIDEVNKLVTDIADTIESLIGFMDDQYMMGKYNVAPLLPNMAQHRIGMDTQTKKDLYSNYVTFLRTILENRLVNAIMDLESLLHYCYIVDGFGQEDKAYSVVLGHFLQNRAVTDGRIQLPAYGMDKLDTFLRYTLNKRDTLSIGETFIETFRRSVAFENLYRKTIASIENEVKGLLSSQDYSSVIYGDPDFITDAKAKINNESLLACDTLLRLCKQEASDYEDYRNWVRPKFVRCVAGIIDVNTYEMMAALKDRIYSFIDKMIQNQLDYVLDRQQKDEILHLKDTSAIKNSCFKKLKEYFSEIFVLPDIEWWKGDASSKTPEYVDTQILLSQILSYCNTSLRVWIDYNWLIEDVIHDSITELEHGYINNAMKKITDSLDSIINKYIQQAITPVIKTK